MPRRSVNLALLIVVPLLVGTGLLAWVAPRPTADALLVWRGVTLADLLARHGVRPSADRVDVVSLTGHAWSFPLREADRLLIATHVGGDTLSPGHGYPARLIAPDRRGFQWIKWVSHVHVA